jgi:serine/threonine protein kinase
LHDLTLDLSTLENTFLFSKHLFNFRERISGIPEIDKDIQKNISKAQEQLKKVYKISLSSAVAAARQKRSRLSQPRSTNLDSIQEDAVLQASFKSIRVIHHVVSILKTHDLLFYFLITLQQKDVATAIRRSDMQPVVLKRISTDSSELSILRLLQSCVSPGSNHIVPLLEVVERPPSMSTLVMPCYTPILDLSQGRAEELSLQLIRGVNWLHKQLISHSDIKETNLVFDETRSRLYIIDFGLAIKLTSREQQVRGARGTAEHVAPEVGIKSSWDTGLEEVFVDEDSIYSPILADVWAVGDVIRNFHEGFGSSTKNIGRVVEEVARELRVDDPTKRLSLHDAERRLTPPATSEIV